MGFYYLSNPYSGTEAQKKERAQRAARTCAEFIRGGVHLLSPIVHNHAMLGVVSDFTLEERQNLILDFDFSLLRASQGMIVLKLEGWDRSHGVEREIEVCRENQIPIYYLEAGEGVEMFKERAFRTVLPDSAATFSSQSSSL